MRPVNWSSFRCNGGLARILIPGRFAFGCGIYCEKTVAALEIIVGGMMLFGNGCPVKGLIIAGWRVDGSVFVLLRPDRFPLNCAGVGTNALTVFPCRTRRPS